MGRGSGLGALLAVLGLVLFLGRKEELTAGAFYTGGPTPPITFKFDWTSEEVRAWATDPEAPEEELVAHATDPLGKWRTINGRIPTPVGGTIPVPVPWPGGIIDVNKMLQPVGVLTPTYTPPTGGRIDINKALRPVEEEASPEVGESVEEASPPIRVFLRPVTR